MYSVKKKFSFLLVLFTSITVLSGCQTVGKTLNLDTDVTLTFDIAKNVNPDDNNVPSPLFVRFYELKSKGVFEQAEFIDLYERDQELLGGDLVAKQELKRLIPGLVRKHTFVLNPETKYIALFSEFFRYNNSRYRLVIPVESNNVFNDKVVVKISNNIMTLSK